MDGLTFRTWNSNMFSTLFIKELFLLRKLVPKQTGIFISILLLGLQKPPILHLSYFRKVTFLFFCLRLSFLNMLYGSNLVSSWLLNAVTKWAWSWKITTIWNRAIRALFLRSSGICAAISLSMHHQQTSFLHWNCFFFLFSFACGQLLAF